MSKKYARDYRLSDTVDERGRIRTETEYVGGAYGYADRDAPKTLKKLTLLSAIAWGLTLLPLFPPSTAGLSIWVMLPWIFLLIPLWRLSSGLWSLRGAGETLQHRHADLANERPEACGAGFAILAGLSLIGEIVALLLPGAKVHPGDLLFLICAGALVACGILCRRLGKGLRAEKT